jgi:hypothetical protein
MRSCAQASPTRGVRVRFALPKTRNTGCPARTERRSARRQRPKQLDSVRGPSESSVVILSAVSPTVTFLLRYSLSDSGMMLVRCVLGPIGYSGQSESGCAMATVPVFDRTSRGARSKDFVADLFSTAGRFLWKRGKVLKSGTRLDRVNRGRLHTTSRRASKSHATLQTAVVGRG